MYIVPQSQTLPPGSLKRGKIENYRDILKDFDSIYMGAGRLSPNAWWSGNSRDAFVTLAALAAREIPI